MKPVIAALLGSPRSRGNTALLFDLAIAGAQDAGCEVQRIDVPSLELSPCREIYFCRSQPDCAIKDDVNRFYSLFCGIDSMIIATPVMTMGIPGALKSFMDRFQVFYCAKYQRMAPLVKKEKRRHRRTLLISISGMDLPDNFDGVRASAFSFCDILDCKLADELFVRDMDHKKDLHTFPDILDEAYHKGYLLGKQASAAVNPPDSQNW